MGIGDWGVGIGDWGLGNGGWLYGGNKSNADKTKVISTHKEENDSNNKIRITNFKPSKMIIEEDDNEKILDEAFFMIKQPIKISSNTELKKSNTITQTQSPQPPNQQTQQINPPPVNKNFAR